MTSKFLVIACFVGLAYPALAGPDVAPPLPHGRDGSSRRDQNLLEKPATTALAIVDGVAIPKSQVDAIIASQLAEVLEYVDEARRQGVYLAINAKLLDQEASRRGVDVKRVLEDEVVAAVVDPPEAEARAYFESHRADLQGGFSDLRDEILKHLRRLREAEKAKDLAERLRARASIRILLEAPRELEAALPPEAILATVNGAAITVQEVERSLGPALANAREKAHELRREALDRCIDQLLIEKETRRRRITVQELLAGEVRSRMVKIGEADVRKFFERDGGKLGLDISRPEDRIRVIRHLQKLEEERCLSELLAQLKARSTVEMLLLSPRHPEEVLAGEDQPLLGDPDAPVSVVIFVDYQCESCAILNANLKHLASQYSGKIKVVARDLPLDTHPDSYQAALAAEAAREQGRYWDYVEVLFEKQHALDREHLREYASRIGLDRHDFDEALDTERHAEKVLADRAAGYQLGLVSTPNIFIGGRRIEDKSRQSLTAAIESALIEASGR